MCKYLFYSIQVYRYIVPRTHLLYIIFFFLFFFSFTEEPLDPNTNHLGFEIHPNSGFDNNNAFDATNIMQTYSDYFDDKHYDTRKHR